MIILMMTIAISKAKTNDVKKVEAAVEAMKQAMISGDEAALNAVAMDELTYGHSSGKLEDKAAFVGNIANGNSDFVSIDLLDQTVTIQGKTAIVRHVLDAKTNDKGVPGTVKLKILLVFVKDHGDWKLLARQAVKFQ